MKKKILLNIAIISILGLISIVLLNYNTYHSVIENKVLYEINGLQDSLSMMIETDYDSGIYDVSADISWPDSSKYVFNADLSGCENGGTLSWNYSTNSLELTNNISDKCYVYFDVSADVTVYIEGNYSSTTPASLTCSNGTASYSNQYRSVSVSTLNYTKCTLTYESSSAITYLNDYIISLVNTEQGDGYVINENGYRFEGKNPNNYVWFNNELWRIIGVFDSDSHGVEGEYLVKLIKATELDGYAWDKSDTNDWTEASLNNLLNNYYYYGLDATDSGYCYGFSTKTCHYEESGINETYRRMIEHVTWYLGGYSSNSVTVDNMYSYEQSSSSTSGYIGLMYISDYGYSVLSSSCDRSNLISSYNTSACAGSSWLYGRGYEWLLTANYSSSYYIFYISTTGYVNSNQANYSFAVRPVLYLDSSVYLVEGDGTSSSPYVIGM